MNQPISHAHCDHASSKAARAKCRRNRGKFNDLFADMAAEALTLAEEPTLTGTELDAAYDGLITAADDLVAKMEADEKFEPIAVTRETWRDFKGLPLRIATQLDDEKQSVHTEGAEITAWGAQWITYKYANGLTKRCSTSCIRVTTIDPSDAGE